MKTLSIELDIDLNQIILDLFGFFKNFAKRIAEYFDVTEFTLVESRRMLKHISTQWISIQDVPRVLEQFSNLKHYFLEALLTQKGFNGKSGIGSMERYIRIKYALTNKKLPSIMASVIFIAKDFKNFTIPLQREAVYDNHALFQNGNVGERHFRKDYHQLSSTIKVIKANCEAEKT